ncbi:MAG: leucine-rich repeat domain-containing protein [Bacteroidales bacterium]|nr:leucine-rich repeat domain-containing protein [Bacteroidales bacterium]
MAVPTAPSPEELDRDFWDADNCLSYSQDGTRLLDAENFPGEVTVKDGCKVICDNVFSFQDYMADVALGEDIPLEERSSFLEAIHLPDTLTHIGSCAFAECGELLSVKLPKNLLYIGESAFVDCWQLEKISIPAKCAVIGPGAFQGCINMYKVTLGKSVAVIGEDAFDDCESLEEILVPKGMKDHFKALLPKRIHKYIVEK